MSDPQPDGIIAALSRALDTSIDEGAFFHAQPPRIVRRSTVHVIATPTPIRGISSWVVKQINPDSSFVDVPSPVGAQQEFHALTRLHAHFEKVGGRARVPEPTGFLPEVGALAMEYIPGRPLSALLNYRGLLRPAPLLDAIAAAGEFIRNVHDLESFAPEPVNLHAEAQAVLSASIEKLRPWGLTLPPQVTRVLSEVPPVVVASRQVWLHGDFCPANVIVADDGSTVGIDPSLNAVGPPEEDLARFIAVMSGSIRLAPEIFAPPAGWLRRKLETQLLSTYYGALSRPPMLELRLIDQLVGRWLRLCQLTEQYGRRSMQATRLRVIGAQTRVLMEDSARRLVQSLAQVRE